MREVVFHVDDVSDLVARMEELVDGSGWIVFDAAVHEDDLPPPSPFAGLLGARGPDVPELSWVPGERGGRRVEPLTIGIRHGAGPKAARTLGEAGHPVPAGWLVVQDNPRRGLVVQVRDDADSAAVLDWLLRAAAILATVPLSGDWRARISFR